MDQNRRNAEAWAKEWYIRRKNQRLLMAVAFVVLVAAIAFLINFIIVHVERTTFKSEEEMRKAMQGRFAIERDYEDIVIEGDDIVLTYLAYSHYNRDYAERYGYNYDEQDSVYEDRVVKWDYRNGVIKTAWMGDIIVDKNGNIRRGDEYYFTFYKTDKPRPEPIDPATLKNVEGDVNADIPEEDEEAFEEIHEDLEALQDAAEDAEMTGESDVES
ncbi:MAG: hypothetical protein IJG48_05180 [Mogibacterium sp.]|nr:hypothetical protein [Mogibacterium sp.]